jgi:hypothetical protein
MHTIDTHGGTLLYYAMQKMWCMSIQDYAVKFIVYILQFDKICMMTTRLACNRAIESSYWRMDNNSDVGLLTGYVLYRLPIELEFMDLDTFSR